MKIYENDLITNQYTAVKSIHSETKLKYKGDLFKNQDKSMLKNDKKFHITKKSEITKTNMNEIAEISANIENKPLNLEGLFKKFNNR